MIILTLSFTRRAAFDLLDWFFFSFELSAFVLYITYSHFQGSDLIFFGAERLATIIFAIAFIFGIV